jgi:autotransporter-associated beta strand protein
LGDAAQNGFHLVKAGPGAQALTGTSTFVGLTSILGGTLSINSDAALGTSPAAFVANQIAIANGATLNTTASMTLHANRGVTLGAGGGVINVNGGTALTYSGRFAGGTGLTKAGTGDLVLTNTAAGQTPGAIQVSAGRLFYQNQETLGSGNVTIASGATLTKNSGTGALSLTNAITQQSGGGISNRGGDLTLPNLTLPTNNGTAIFNSDDVATSAGQIIIPGNQTLTGTFTVQVGGSNANVGAVRFDGQIGGAGNLTKTQVGRLILTNGGNSYAGVTNVLAGTLQVNANNALGSTAAGTTVSSGGTLEFNGAFDYSAAESLTISGPGFGGVGALNKTNGSGTLTSPVSLAGSATIGSATAGSTLTVLSNIRFGSDLTFTGAGDIVMAGDLIGAPTESLANLNNLTTGNHNFTADGQTFDAFVDNVAGTGWTSIRTAPTHPLRP